MNTENASRSMTWVTRRRRTIITRDDHRMQAMRRE
jgi:hypothetical protein